MCETLDQQICRIVTLEFPGILIVAAVEPEILASHSMLCIGVEITLSMPGPLGMYWSWRGFFPCVVN